jgi:hypothetical protein
LLLRWYSLISLERAGTVVAGTIAAMTLGPATSVALAWISRPVDPAAVRRLAPITNTTALIAIGEGILAAMLCGIRLGTVLVIVAWLLVRFASTFVRWRFGGVRGSDLEAFRIVVETAAFVLAASLRRLP